MSGFVQHLTANRVHKSRLLHKYHFGEQRILRKGQCLWKICILKQILRQRVDRGIDDTRNEPYILQLATLNRIFRVKRKCLRLWFYFFDALRFRRTAELTIKLRRQAIAQVGALCDMREWLLSNGEVVNHVHDQMLLLCRTNDKGKPTPFRVRTVAELREIRLIECVADIIFSCIFEELLSDQRSIDAVVDSTTNFMCDKVIAQYLEDLITRAVSPDAFVNIDLLESGKLNVVHRYQKSNSHEAQDTTMHAINDDSNAISDSYDQAVIDALADEFDRVHRDSYYNAAQVGKAHGFATVLVSKIDVFPTMNAALPPKNDTEKMLAQDQRAREKQERIALQRENRLLRSLLGRLDSTLPVMALSDSESDRDDIEQFADEAKLSTETLEPPKLLNFDQTSSASDDLQTELLLSADFAAGAVDALGQRMTNTDADIQNVHIGGDGFDGDAPGIVFGMKNLANSTSQFGTIESLCAQRHSITDESKTQSNEVREQSASLIQACGKPAILPSIAGARSGSSGARRRHTSAAPVSSSAPGISGSTPKLKHVPSAALLKKLEIKDKERRAENMRLKKLLLLRRAEEEMKKVDLLAPEGQRKTIPPRTRLLSDSRTLPEFDAVRTEKVARNVITTVRIALSGGLVERVDAPLSVAEKMLLESPFATPFADLYQAKVEKEEARRRLERDRSIANGSLAGSSSKGLAHARPHVLHPMDTTNFGGDHRHHRRISAPSSLVNAVPGQYDLHIISPTGIRKKKGKLKKLRDA